MGEIPRRRADARARAAAGGGGHGRGAAAVRQRLDVLPARLAARRLRSTTEALRRGGAERRAGDADPRRQPSRHGVAERGAKNGVYEAADTEVVILRAEDDTTPD